MNEYWGVFAQLGLWGWVAAVLFFINYSFPAINEFSAKNAFRWGTVSMLFFVFWVTGMLLA